MSSIVWAFTDYGCRITNNGWVTRLTRFKEGNMRYDKKFCKPTIEDIYRVKLEDGRECIAVWASDSFRKAKVVINGVVSREIEGIDDTHSLRANWWTSLDSKVVSWEPI